MTVERYEVNPFLGDFMIPIKQKNIKVSPLLGKDRNVLINQETGECFGTHVTTYKRVDAEKFVKLFTANIALTFNLKPAGIKALSVLIWTVQNTSINKDLVLLDKYCLSDFMAAHAEQEPPLKLSAPTFLRGLSELEKSSIIAKNIRKGWYFINPNFVFSGDRIAFTQVIEKEKIPSKNEDEQLQLSVDDCN
ncbi:replication/maintenance protein RepL [Vibrio cholerae]